jgi:hypothetical protein
VGLFCKTKDFSREGAESAKENLKYWIKDNFTQRYREHKEKKREI